MNNLTCDYIAIDTNIFEHLFNPQNNKCDHIEILLHKLARDNVHLIIDTHGRIRGEYAYRIIGQIKKTKSPNHADLLRYWLAPDAPNKEVTVNQNDNLMGAIKGVMGKSDATDRIFVYVAIHGDQVLITNDRNDILDGGNSKYDRRDRLLKIAKKQGFKSARIHDSKEAHDEL